MAVRAQPRDRRTPAAGFKLRVNSYVQGDLRSRRNFTDGDDEEAGLNGTETMLRRARIGLDGEWRRFSFEVQVDPIDERRAPQGPLPASFKIAKALRHPRRLSEGRR